MNVLSFGSLIRGEFVCRPNRFVAIVRVNDTERRVHVHDPGRLTELLRPGAPVLLLPKRSAKTDFHLVAVYREGYGWIFQHSGYHSLIAQKLVESRALPEFRDAVAYGKEIPIDNHRIDFVLSYNTGDILMEVKGCTLFRDDIALFPDAPTKRGREHVDLLAEYGDAILLFLVMSGHVRYFAPNVETDPEFQKSLLNALERGVHIVPATFSFDGETLYHVGRIPFISDPHDDELFALADLAAEAVQDYNARFSPEAQAILSGVSRLSGIPHIHFVVRGLGDLHAYLGDLQHIFTDFGIIGQTSPGLRFGRNVIGQMRLKEF
ncbi:MAG: DNA/RNA nuclease SfsA [Candidatus Diapherotrites archaeon]|nr:DNA/RNA nuclease SfsA [Candidatus Diapherotrites archaeon]